MKKKFFGLLIIMLAAGAASAAGNADRHGWCVQKAPVRVAICPQEETLYMRCLTASLAGLAAQAVNEGTFTEMVWEDVDSPEAYSAHYIDVVNALAIETVHEAEVFDLLSEYVEAGIVNGYVLYRTDKSPGRQYSRREGIDLSVNVATVYAGVLGAVLVSEEIEDEVKNLGLKCLKDCRDISPEECFESLRGKLNNGGVAFIDPQTHNCRDYAIAHKLMVGYDVGPLSEKICEWVAPLSPVIGWNCPDEFSHTAMISRYGLFNTATDRCENMTLMAAASSRMTPLRISEKGPQDIDFSADGPFHSFLLSDGDNMQWSEGNFLTSESFYASPRKGEFGVNWTSCTVNLSVMAVPAWNAIVSGKPDCNSIVEFGGGYYYPDLFAVSRPDRAELLAEFARGTGERMNELGVSLICFICSDSRSEAAMEAFRIFAQEIKGLTGIVVLDYYPYENGGEIRWVQDSEGNDIPVAGAAYSIWDTDDANRPNAGSPSKVAGLINAADDSSALSFTIVHVWSEFGGESGVDASYMAANLFDERVKTVSLNELFWRIRMKNGTGK